MSVRLGIMSPSRLVHQFGEAFEQIVAVGGARGGFRVVLDEKIPAGRRHLSLR